jgi:hypothetical protein
MVCGSKNQVKTESEVTQEQQRMFPQAIAYTKSQRPRPICKAIERFVHEQKDPHQRVYNGLGVESRKKMSSYTRPDED